MFGHQFYHSALRKYVIMFGNMFNDIDVVRYNNNVAVQSIRVPIAYGPAEKFLTRIAQDPSRGTNAAVQLPRMAFEITGFTYDPTRGLNRLTKNSAIGAPRRNWLSSPRRRPRALYLRAEVTRMGMRIGMDMKKRPLIKLQVRRCHLRERRRWSW